MRCAEENCYGTAAQKGLCQYHFEERWLASQINATLKHITKIAKEGQKEDYSAYRQEALKLFSAINMCASEKIAQILDRMKGG